ncbi:asl4091 [Nostoc sp. PCC 7120 = FACHB-418]|nr:asl4091 [Nostoc sp. PCC 7120 = FACHB-418]
MQLQATPIIIKLDSYINSQTSDEKNSTFTIQSLTPSSFFKYLRFAYYLDKFTTFTITS